MSEIVDGTSNTMLFSEHAHGLLSSDDQQFYQWWNSGYWGDTTFSTAYPINYARKVPARQIENNGWWIIPIEGTSSFHPGGANFAFADGSVKFIKETIASWPIDNVTGPLGSGPDPVGLQWGGQFGIQPSYGTAVPRVYQQLSTRNGNETISADAF